MLWVLKTGCNPLNINELWPRPKRGVGYRQKKIPVSYDITPDIINQNQVCLNILCPEQEKTY